ncbi:partner of xrn-2 protein 1-like isoform X2 [Aphis craccivora]|uniref:Partner of xrn-2 protein 1-like isoform X2 n=1 Tax=Aphis craccivora TaxID=307492 RepID=A0A6G0YBA2_APHCR|nr:partner of xrn-2 protein 1-like isoform X2 [Aphis craccivora]
MQFRLDSTVRVFRQRNKCLLFPFPSLAFSLTIICLIETLSEVLADDLSEKCKGKLQRTFVAASDAAEAKTKRWLIFFPLVHGHAECELACSNTSAAIS